MHTRNARKEEREIGTKQVFEEIMNLEDFSKFRYNQTKSHKEK